MRRTVEGVLVVHDHGQPIRDVLAIEFDAFHPCAGASVGQLGIPPMQSARGAREIVEEFVDERVKVRRIMYIVGEVEEAAI